MFNQNQKRLLQSPEQSVASAKFPKPDDSNSMMNTTSATSDSNAVEHTLEPRDQTLLDNFARILCRELDSRFSSFAQHQIAPLKQEITCIKEDVSTLKSEVEALKIENCNLQQTIEKYESKVSSMEKDARDFNLIFHNVAKSPNVYQMIKDVCKEVLKVDRDIFLRRCVILKENKQQQTVDVLAKMESTSMVEAILKNTRYLKGAQSRISISKDLSEEDRRDRRVLLNLKRKITNTSKESKVKVLGNSILIDGTKLNYRSKSNYFGNSDVDGKAFLNERFSIDFSSLANSSQ